MLEFLNGVEFRLNPRMTITAGNPALVFSLEAKLNHFKAASSVERRNGPAKGQFTIERVSFFNVFSEDVFCDFPYTNLAAFEDATARSGQFVTVLQRQVTANFAGEFVRHG